MPYCGPNDQRSTVSGFRLITDYPHTRGMKCMNNRDSRCLAGSEQSTQEYSD